MQRNLEWVDPRKVMPIVVYCKSGRDRSVGCAAILACWFRRGRPDNVVLVYFQYSTFCFIFYLLTAVSLLISCISNTQLGYFLCICSTHCLYIFQYICVSKVVPPPHTTPHMSPLVYVGGSAAGLRTWSTSASRSGAATWAACSKRATPTRPRARTALRRAPRWQCEPPQERWACSCTQRCRASGSPARSERAGLSGG